MSTTIRPHTKPVQLIFPPTSLEKDRTFLPLLSKCSHRFPFLLSLISFSCQSPSLHLKTLPSSTELNFPLLPLSSLLYNPRYFPLFFPLLAYKPALLLYLSSFSRISSSHSCPSSWSNRSLSLQALLLPLCLVRLPVKLLLYSAPCW